MFYSQHRQIHQVNQRTGNHIWVVEKKKKARPNKMFKELLKNDF